MNVDLEFFLFLIIKIFHSFSFASTYVTTLVESSILINREKIILPKIQPNARIRFLSRKILYFFIFPKRHHRRRNRKTHSVEIIKENRFFNPLRITGLVSDLE